MGFFLRKTSSLTLFLFLFVPAWAVPFINTTQRNTTSLANTTDPIVHREETFEEGSCHFDDDFCLWRNEEGSDDFDWVRQQGRTPSSNTGPAADRSGQGSYVYAEVSWPRKSGETAQLIGGPFSGTKCIRFYYHMFGRYVADLQIFLRENGMESFIWGRFKNQGNIWRHSNATVFGQNYTVAVRGRLISICFRPGYLARGVPGDQVIFSARVGQSYLGDIAVDDITFVNGTCDGKGIKYVPKLRNVSGLLQQARGEPGTCNFDGGFCDWINLPLDDQFDWKLNSGETGTALTGPTEDHTGNQGGYIYIEGSEPQRSGHTAYLLGPRMCGRMCMRFFYHMYGIGMGTLNVFKREGRGSDDLIWSQSGDQGIAWHEALVDVGGACYQIVFEGVVGPRYLSDAAVDDVFFIKGTCCESRMESFDAGLVGNCTFDEDLCDWRNDDSDDFDWKLIEGGTPSRYTGPNAGYNGQGQYIYVESSEPRQSGAKAVLVSGILQGLQCMRFKYHMHGVDMGSLGVYLIGDGIMKTRLWRVRANQGDTWHEARITIPCNASSYMLEIEAVIGVWRGDIAVDNIEFTKGACPTIKPTTAAPTTQRATPTRSPVLADVQSENDCSFAGHFCSWKNDNTDDFDWLINNGSTLTRLTGPSTDADGDGGYIYLEASLQTMDQRTRLISGYMYGTQCMQFQYHMWGTGIGSLRISQVDKRGRRPRMVWSRTGNQGPKWKETQLNLFGRVFQLVIEGVRGQTFEGDIAVDAIAFTPERCRLKEASEEEIEADSHLGSGVCSFDTNFCRWRNEQTEDQFDWQINEGRTPSKGTGPDSGFGGSGKYAFIEASAPRKPGDKAMLAIYGSGKNRCLFFAYHMSGYRVGSLSVYQKELGRGFHPQRLWTRNGQQGNRWYVARVDIKGHQKYKVIIEAVRGSSFRGDIAIDNVGFQEGFCGKRSI